MTKRRILLWLLGLLALLVMLAPILRPPIWRALLYEGMFDACADDDVAGARIWLFLGASPDGLSDYRASSAYQHYDFTSTIEIVASHPDCRLLRLLLSKGAAPDLKEGCEGGTPLSTAVNSHNREATKILLEAGANPRYTDQWTAVDQAQWLHFDDLIPIIQPYLIGE